MSKNTTNRHKPINWIMFVIFSLFAYVQLNDPDPLIWFSLYAMVALIAGFLNFGRVPRLVFYIAIACLSIYSMFHAGYFYEWLGGDDKSEIFGEMVYEKPYIEGTREFLGLLIAIGSLLWLARSNHLAD